MNSDTRGFAAGLKAGDAILKSALDNIQGEHSSAARIERVMLRQLRRQFKEAIEVNKGKSDAPL